MRKPGRLLFVLPALLLLVALVGLVYGVTTLRRSWPKIDGAVEMDGLHAQVTVVRDSWGSLHTASFENQSVGQCGIGPVERIFNRGPSAVDGSLATVNQANYDMSKPFSVRTIASYRQIVDLGNLTRSVSMHTTGQSGHPFHRHYDDMIDPWRDVEYHPMLWERTQVEADAEGVLILTP